MTIVRTLTEEYWTVQYKTRVTGCGVIFWPEDGSGRFGSEEQAAAVARKLVEIGEHEITRVVHVTREQRFGDPITKQTKEQ